MADNNKTPEYELHPPTIYESQLFPPEERGNEDESDGCNLQLRQSNQINFSGPRGSGKTMSLYELGVKAKVAGLKVWSNFPFAIYCIMDVTGHGEKKFFETELLDLKKFLTRQDPVKGGWVLLDEYQDIASAYTFNQTKNRLLAATWAQIRKDELGFAYTSKFRKWVDTRTRDELDIEFMCMDASRTPWGRGEYRRGEMVFWQMADWSGVLTGYQFETYPKLYPYKFYSKPLWGGYPTNYRIDIFEAMRGMKLDLEKDVISDKNLNDIDYDAMIEAAKKLFERMPKWKPSDFWTELGVFSQADQRLCKKALRDNLGMIDGSISRPQFQLPGAVNLDNYVEELAGVPA